MICDLSIRSVPPVTAKPEHGQNMPCAYWMNSLFTTIFHPRPTIVLPSLVRLESEKQATRPCFDTTHPWDMLERLNQTGGKVALVFGEEGKGLSTEDLGACDYFVTLPTWEGYPIANLSHAVNALLYEIQRHRVLNSQGDDPGLPDIVPLEPQLQPDVREALTRAIHQFALASGSTEERQKSIEQTLKRTLLKGSPSTDESTRMIGAFVEATSAMEFASGDEAWKKDHRRKLR